MGHHPLRTASLMCFSCFSHGTAYEQHMLEVKEVIDMFL
jgi:hypothetical protein